MSQVSTLERPPRAEAASQPPDPQEFRRLMALWPTGVAVVSGLGDAGEPLGFVVGSLCSVSLDPMLVAFCIQKTSSTWAQFRARERFALNFLAVDQADLCWRFASGEPAQRFAGLQYARSRGGQPLLAGSCAWLDVQLAQEIDAGDHWLALCQVAALQAGPSNAPLAFARGRLNRLEACQPPAPDHLERWERAFNDLQFAT